jgi:hypothetical protein
MTLAIVSTVRDAGKVLDSFIRYHVAIGFDRLFIIFDDPCDPMAESARRYPQVTALTNDDGLRRRWKTRRSYARVGPFIDDHVMSRQILNAEVAIEMALEMGLEWILHIDVDELFHSQEAPKKHFESLAERGIDFVTYPNHEAVPEAFKIDDYFKTVTLFNKNAYTLEAGQARGRRRFLYYGNGKSAARLCRNLMAKSVHEFMLSRERSWAYRNFLHLFLPYRKIPLVKPRVSFGGSWRKRGSGGSRAASQDVHKLPVILHYACCGFQHFWQKYKTLGSFPDRWFGRVELSRQVPFHVQARNVVMTQGREAARKLYQEVVMAGGEQETRDRLEAGTFCRIVEPSRLLA